MKNKYLLILLAILFFTISSSAQHPRPLKPIKKSVLTDKDGQEQIAKVPKTADDYLDLGQKKEISGDLDSALAAFNQVLILNANKDQSNVDVLAANSIASISRDNLQIATGDFDNALINYREDKPGNYVGIGVGSCYIWVIQNKKGNDKEADLELSSTLIATASGIANDNAAIAISKFLLGKMSENDLVAALVSEDAKTTDGKGHDYAGEGYYFIGEKYLLARDRVTAANNFRKALSLKSIGLENSIIIQAELKAMSQSN